MLIDRSNQVPSLELIEMSQHSTTSLTRGTGTMVQETPFLCNHLGTVQLELVRRLYTCVVRRSRTVRYGWTVQVF
jgi:hypothetical protein